MLLTLGGSVVIFIPACRMEMGNSGCGELLNHSRNSGWGSSIWSCSTNLSSCGIQLSDKWQFARNTQLPCERINIKILVSDDPVLCVWNLIRTIFFLDYAQAHFDISTRTRGRFFRGPLAKLRFKSYWCHYNFSAGILYCEQHATDVRKIIVLNSQMLQCDSDLTSLTPSLIILVAMGAWPWPRDRAWNLAAIPLTSASWSSALVGSTPELSTNMSGVLVLESSTTLCMSSTGGSVNLDPRLLMMKAVTQNDTRSARSDRIISIFCNSLHALSHSPAEGISITCHHTHTNMLVKWIFVFRHAITFARCVEGW